MEPTGRAENGKKPLGSVVQIDDKIQAHPGSGGASHAEETLNALLDAEAAQRCGLTDCAQFRPGTSSSPSSVLAAERSPFRWRVSTSAATFWNRTKPA
jgi:hypothetical protein